MVSGKKQTVYSWLIPLARGLTMNTMQCSATALSLAFVCEWGPHSATADLRKKVSSPCSRAISRKEEPGVVGGCEKKRH